MPLVRGIDPWHVIGAVGEPAFVNGWRHFGNLTPPQSANYGGARFRKTRDGMVIVTGMLDKNGGNFAAAETIFTLPVGYVPDTQIAFSTKMLGGATENDGRINVFPSGIVQLNTGGLANPVVFASLDGIVFFAA